MAAAVKAKETVVTLQPINIQKTAITLIGETELVTHPFPKKAMEQIEAKQHSPKSKAIQHSIRNEWEDFCESLYWLSDPPTDYTEEAWNKIKDSAVFGFHVGGIKSSAVTAAQRRGATKGTGVANGTFFITNAVNDRLYGIPCVPIIISEPPYMRKDCLSTFTSGADMRYRPVFQNWKIELEIEYDAAMVSIEQLATWFQLGGFSCGLGEYRAEKGGMWGRYRVG